MSCGHDLLDFCVHSLLMLKVGRYQPQKIQSSHLKVMLIVSWSIPILASVLSFIIPPASSFVLSFGFLIFAFGDLSIFFFHFLVLVVLLHRKKTTKQITARPVSMKLTIRMEVRVTCTLAIATGVFTICWVPPVIVLVFAAKTLKLNGPLHMWLQTLALSNSRP